MNKVRFQIKCTHEKDFNMIFSKKAGRSSLMLLFLLLGIPKNFLLALPPRQSSNIPSAANAVTPLPTTQNALSELPATPDVIIKTCSGSSTQSKWVGSSPSECEGKIIFEICKNSNEKDTCQFTYHSSQIREGKGEINFVDNKFIGECINVEKTTGVKGQLACIHASAEPQFSCYLDETKSPPQMKCYYLSAKGAVRK